MLVANKRPQEFQQYNQQRAKSRAHGHRQASVYTVGEKLKMFAAVLACVVMAIAVISHYAYVVNVTRQVELATVKLDALQEEGKHLKLEIASLRTLGRLEEKAYEIGMQYPGREQMVILTAGAADN
ncbi:MAG: cell division protein FtsL [Firmicutes bacterium]|nr:cell division protein FtsL [Bacillota bacterium]